MWVTHSPSTVHGFCSKTFSSRTLGSNFRHNSRRVKYVFHHPVKISSGLRVITILTYYYDLMTLQINLYQQLFVKLKRRTIFEVDR
jgi:hypothetical protein